MRDWRRRLGAVEAHAAEGFAAGAASTAISQFGHLAELGPTLLGLKAVLNTQRALVRTRQGLVSTGKIPA